MTTGKSDSNDDSSQAKDGSAQDMSPEDSQVLQQFPWLKKLKATNEVANSTEAPVQESQSKSENPQQEADETDQGRTKKKKRGAGKKKVQSESTNEAATAPTTQKRKQSKKGKSGAKSQVEPTGSEAAPVAQSNIQSNDQSSSAPEVPEADETTSSEPETSAAPVIETDASPEASAAPEMEANLPTEIETPTGERSSEPETPTHRVVKTTLMENYISTLLDGQPSDSTEERSAPEAVPESTPPSPPPADRVVAKTLLETDISKFMNNQPADEKVAPEVVPDSPPAPANRVAKTMLEMDISKFVDAPQTPATDVPEAVAPSPESAPAPEPTRVVAKTLLETDISKFIDNQQSNSVTNNITPEAVPESAPPAAPANRVAKTMLEIDVAKFMDNAQTATPDIAPVAETPSEPAPGEPKRPVAKTLLETDISKFIDQVQPNDATTNQPPETIGTSENRVVPRTMLEADFPTLPVQQPGISEPTQQAQNVPAQESPPRVVAKTLIETDISKFIDGPQPNEQYSDNFQNSQRPMDSPSPQTLSKADSPSFADVEMPQQINLVRSQDNFAPQQADEIPQSDFSNYQSQESAQTEERYVPKTLLDMDLIQETLGNTMTRMEAAAEELRSSQSMKKFEPIVDFKLTTANCPWRWDDPYTKERVAFCEQCGAQAYNFSGLQLPEALKLIFQRENIDKPKLFKREDGKFMTRDCPLAQKKAATPFLIAGICLLVIAFTALVFLFMPKNAPVETSQTQSDKSQTQSDKSPSQTDAKTPSQTGANTPSQTNTSTQSQPTTSSPEATHTRHFNRPSSGSK